MFENRLLALLYVASVAARTLSRTNVNICFFSVILLHRTRLFGFGLHGKKKSPHVSLT